MKQIDEQTAVRRLCFKEVWPTAPRDFLVCASWRRRDEYCLEIGSRSVSDSLYQQQQQEQKCCRYIRGFLQFSGYILQSYDPNLPILVESTDQGEKYLSPDECMVTLINHSELGGSVPAAIVNMLSTSAPIKLLSSLADIVCKK